MFPMFTHTQSSSSTSSTAVRTTQSYSPRPITSLAVENLSIEMARLSFICGLSLLALGIASVVRFPRMLSYAGMARDLLAAIYERTSPEKQLSSGRISSTQRHESEYIGFACRPTAKKTPVHSR